MRITPSASSAGVAGMMFWLLPWSLLHKIDKRQRVVSWILKSTSNKVTALTCTEMVNYAMHGITNPLSVMFAIGGTVTNIIMIFFVLPSCAFYRKKKLAIFKTAA